MNTKLVGSSLLLSRVYCIRSKVLLHHSHTQTSLSIVRLNTNIVDICMFCSQDIVYVNYDCALRWTSEDGHRDIVALLLKHKANVVFKFVDLHMFLTNFEICIYFQMFSKILNQETQYVVEIECYKNRDKLDEHQQT
jgi:hypothetical protein